MRHVATLDHTHDPAALSWVAGADAHADFPVQNLPLGVFSRPGDSASIGVAIGDFILDLTALADRGLIDQAWSDPVRQSSLNAIFALAPRQRVDLRRALHELLRDPLMEAQVKPAILPASACTMHLPCNIGDYTDFYVGIHHATNIGKQFRPDSPLLPNYKHVPIGYHGRASSVRPSATGVIRPSGQFMLPGDSAPRYGPSRKLDFELELGVWIAGENALGTPVPIAQAHDRIAGLCLLNDWSARDLQAWEYQPLGPFLGKNFLTSVSPWVVTREALAPFRIAQSQRSPDDPKLLPYLWDEADQARGAYAIRFNAAIQTRQMRDASLPAQRLSSVDAANMYWTAAQMIAHHTVNGCNLRAGDLLGTGTISGPDRQSLGSLMEISFGGTAPIRLETGETRGFLEDGDHLTIRAQAHAEGFRSIGFGSCEGTVCQAANI